MDLCDFINCSLFNQLLDQDSNQQNVNKRHPIGLIQNLEVSDIEKMKL